MEAIEMLKQEGDEESLENLIKYALANPRGDALMDELMRMYVHKPVMQDGEEVSGKVMAHRGGKAELVLMINNILEEAAYE